MPLVQAGNSRKNCGFRNCVRAWVRVTDPLHIDR